MCSLPSEPAQLCLEYTCHAQVVPGGLGWPGMGSKVMPLKTWPSLGAWRQARSSCGSSCQAQAVLTLPDWRQLCIICAWVFRYMVHWIVCTFQACTMPAVSTRSSKGDAKLEEGATQHADISTPQRQHHHDNEAKEPPAWRQVCIPIWQIQLHGMRR